LCAIGGSVFRRSTSPGAVEGPPRPKRTTMSSVSVRLVERGAGEDGVPVPGGRAGVSPGAEAAAYAADPERPWSPTPLTCSATCHRRQHHR
jgi:hypothetical protein